MKELIEFLRARLDEDEEWAHDPECDQDPARLLREVGAKRAIVDQLRFIEAGVLIVGTNHPEYRSGLLFAIRALASSYSDHEHYNPEWRI